MKVLPMRSQIEMSLSQAGVFCHMLTIFITDAILTVSFGHALIMVINTKTHKKSILHNSLFVSLTVLSINDGISPRDEKQLLQESQLMNS